MKSFRLATLLARIFQRRGVASGVAQTSSLLYRRIPFGSALERPAALKTRGVCGLEIRDTAGWKPALRFIVSLSLAAFILTGCGKKHDAGDGHDHGKEKAEGKADGHGHEEEAPGGASFKAGKGILLGDEAAQEIGLETAEVAEKPVALQFSANARVFHPAREHTGEPEWRPGHAQASVLVPTNQAAQLQTGQPVAVRHFDTSMAQGRIIRLARDTARAIGQVEVVIEVPDPQQDCDFGQFLKVTFTAPERPATVIPRAALLEAATGTFVYVKNGGHFLRTPVKAGATSGDLVEVVDGLFPGDVVVSHGAEKLWLIELRFTKGGGHSH